MDNRFDVYKSIRYQRTYRTIGKITWWRILLGAILLASVFFISGVVSQRIAARGNFYLAEKLMVSPQWMEKHKPETKAFIEAGVLYQDGDYEAASEAFAVIEDVDAAVAMKSSCDVKLARIDFEAGEYESAFNFINSADYSLLSEEDLLEYKDICTLLYEHFKGSNFDGSAEYAEKMFQLIELYSEN